MKKVNVRTMTIEDLTDLIASGNDTKDSQLRINNNDEIYISYDYVGADNLTDIKSRFETFDAGNGYIGLEASQDKKYVKQLFETIKYNWGNGFPNTYIDTWL